MLVWSAMPVDVWCFINNWILSSKWNAMFEHINIMAKHACQRCPSCCWFDQTLVFQTQIIGFGQLTKKNPTVKQWQKNNIADDKLQATRNILSRILLLLAFNMQNNIKNNNSSHINSIVSVPRMIIENERVIEIVGATEGRTENEETKQRIVCRKMYVLHNKMHAWFCSMLEIY